MKVRQARSRHGPPKQYLSMKAWYLVLVTVGVCIAIFVAIVQVAPPGSSWTQCSGANCSPTTQDLADKDSIISASEPSKAHILMSFDGPDVAGFPVAARSILMATADPALVHFHLVTPQASAAKVRQACTSCLDGIGGIDSSGAAACSTGQPHQGVFCCEDQVHFLRGVDTSTTTAVGIAAKRVSSPFNAARFAGMDAMVDVADRFVYMDPDIAVAGDVQELVHMDLGGQAAALARILHVKGEQKQSMCSVKVGVDCNGPGVRERLLGLGVDTKKLSKEWVGNAGIVVIDGAKWGQQRLGDASREWMARNEGGKMWQLGTQPPTNLALLGNRAEIDPRWNTPWIRLGRTSEGDEAPLLMHFPGEEYKAWRTSPKNMAKVIKGHWAAQRYYDLSVLYHRACFVGVGSEPAPEAGEGTRRWGWDAKTGIRVPPREAGVLSRSADPFRFRREPAVLVVVALDGEEREVANLIVGAEKSLASPWPWTALQVFVAATSEKVVNVVRRKADCIPGGTGEGEELSMETCRSIRGVVMGTPMQHGDHGGGLQITGASVVCRDGGEWDPQGARPLRAGIWRETQGAYMRGGAPDRLGDRFGAVEGALGELPSYVTRAIVVPWPGGGTVLVQAGCTTPLPCASGVEQAAPW